MRSSAVSSSSTGVPRSAAGICWVMASGNFCANSSGEIGWPAAVKCAANWSARSPDGWRATRPRVSCRHHRCSPAARPPRRADEIGARMPFAGLQRRGFDLRADLLHDLGRALEEGVGLLQGHAIRIGRQPGLVEQTLPMLGVADARAVVRHRDGDVAARRLGLGVGIRVAGQGVGHVLRRRFAVRLPVRIPILERRNSTLPVFGSPVAADILVMRSCKRSGERCADLALLEPGRRGVARARAAYTTPGLRHAPGVAPSARVRAPPHRGWPPLRTASPGWRR